jgi:tetratricopeptide (TPR) repeat protein
VPDPQVPEGFAARFRRLREAASLTKTALAAGRYTVSYVSQIEAGRRTPAPEALAFFAGRLGVSTQHLATGVPDGLAERISYSLEQARDVLLRGRPAESLELATSLLAEIDRFGVTAMRPRAVLVVATALLFQGKAHEAIDRYEEALESELLADRERGLATASLARAYRTVGDLAYAADLVESFVRGHAAPLDPIVAADLHSVLVSIAFERGDMTRAERASRLAIAAAEQASSPLLRANVLWDASRLLAEAKRWGEALELATRARTIIEDAEDQRRIAQVHNLCALLCLENDPPALDDARRYLDSAERLLADVAQPGDFGQVFAQRARLALLERRAQDALAHSERAIAESGEDMLEKARSTFLRGRALAELGRRGDALASFRDAATVFAKTGARQQEASCWREIGELELDAGDTAAAIASLRAGLEALDPRRSRA